MSKFNDATGSFEGDLADGIREVRSVGSRKVISSPEAVGDWSDTKTKQDNGEITTIKIPWPRLNEETRGLKLGSITCVAGHSGTGKTAFANAIKYTAYALNPALNIRVLMLTYEMPAKDLITRDLSYIMDKTAQEIDYDMKLADIPQKHLDELASAPIDYVQIPQTPEGIAGQIYNWAKKYPDNHILVILDHTLLMWGDRSDNDKISDLVSAINDARKVKTNFTTIILSQLNDAFLSNERIKARAYPQLNDLYNGRQLVQMCDLVLVLNNPSNYVDGTYGTKKLPLKIYNKSTKEYDSIIYCHIIKARSGAKDIIAFRDNLKYNKMYEIDPDVITKMIPTGRSSSPTTSATDFYNS